MRRLKSKATPTQLLASFHTRINISFRFQHESKFSTKPYPGRRLIAILVSIKLQASKLFENEAKHCQWRNTFVNCGSGNRERLNLTNESLND
jgi:hypothetical protein